MAPPSDEQLQSMLACDLARPQLFKLLVDAKWHGISASNPAILVGSVGGFLAALASFVRVPSCSRVALGTLAVATGVTFVLPRPNYNHTGLLSIVNKYSLADNQEVLDILRTRV